MKLPKKIVETVDAKYVTVHAKVCDSGSYELSTEGGQKLGELEDYVPSFFPEQHHGDYLILKIDLETGLIANWKKGIEPIEVARAFGLVSEDET